MIRYRYNILCALILIAFAGNTYAGGFFRPFEGKTAPSKGEQILVPDYYRVFSADQNALVAYLSGLGTDAAHPSIISLPKPDGTSMDFYIWSASIMEPSLQNKYAQIQTFTAVAKTNRNITAKIDFTVNGFHAMIFNGENTFMIDPYSDIADGYYSVYFKKDYKRPAGHMMTCDLGDDEMIQDASGNHPETMDGTLPDLGLKQFGSMKKSFRLALACTGEYALAVGGTIPTKASVLSAMVTSMNRVNGIYERELGVTMVFISNNDTLIYLSPGSDPFTGNDNGNQLLGQNQSNTVSIIGSANYDIGHIFSTGGGGVAFLGCVCKNSQKARGVTGSANPVGDAYDVDYVAHEMGHQFGANHSFNKCSGTESMNSAYEPGSGSTIMAYAGICGSINNIQAHSDAYFHWRSLDAISDYLENDAGCATNTPGTPLVTLPPIVSTYAIPFNTPFELTAPVATADSSDTISYCWEQADLGDFRRDEDSARFFLAGPSFRSFQPKGSGVRVFPVIDSLIKNVMSYRGERFSVGARTLTFRLTARNIYNGLGAFDMSEDVVTLNVINTDTAFKITSPNLSTDTFHVNGPGQITWNVSKTDLTPISTPNVDIFLSVDGGYTYPYTLATGVPNTGSYVVTVPDTVTNKARVKVKGAGNVFFDISNANFRIVDTNKILSVHDIELENDILIYPNPASSQLTINNNGAAELALVLFNTLGQKVWEGTVNRKITIPVANYARGFYYLRISDLQKGSKAVKRITLQ